MTLQERPDTLNVKAATKSVAQLGRQRQWKEALHTLRRLSWARVPFDQILLGAAVGACGVPSAWESVLALLCAAEADNSGKSGNTGMLSTALLNSGMDSLVKAGQWQWALHLLHEMSVTRLRLCGNLSLELCLCHVQQHSESTRGGGNPTKGTQRPRKTRSPKPQTSNPQTPNPKPQTLNPKPQIPNPKP